MKFLIPEYRGYIGSIEHSKEDGVFFGSIQFITDMVSYESEDLNNIETAFHNAVDEYIADCSSLNKLPDKPTQQKKFVDWHPYPEETPQSGDNYLVTVIDQSDHKTRYVGTALFLNVTGWNVSSRYRVIAWANLPEPDLRDI